jgi:hypothetical protein
MNNFEWIKDYYKVPAQFGRDVKVGSKLGTITEDMGTYIGVVFEGKSHAVPCHPTSEVVYLDTFNSVMPKKISRSAQRYRDYLHADSSLSFKEWLGIK